jgi:hypothetical protein
VREVFEEHNQDLWYSFTMSLDREGEFSVSFDYTNWFQTDYGFFSAAQTLEVQIFK